jgi:hypothetical protein
MAKKQYSSLEEYLEDNKDIVADCSHQVINDKRNIEQYIYSLSDGIIGKSKKNRNYYLDNFLAQYSLFKEEGEPKEQLEYLSLYAVTMQILADYYIQEYNKKFDDYFNE